MVQRKSGHVTLLDIAQACGYRRVVSTDEQSATQAR